MGNELEISIGTRGSKDRRGDEDINIVEKWIVEK
jgi:hypothetical protein